MMFLIKELEWVVFNINWRDVKRKTAVNNVDSKCFREPGKTGPYKNKHVEQYKTRRTTRRTRPFVCFGFF